MSLVLDKEGFLAELGSWNAATAEALAHNEGIALSDEHWEVIVALRDFYARTEVSPSMRPFVKLISESLGREKGRSIHLMRLFGPSPAKTAAKIAGLPRPTNCL